MKTTNDLPTNIGLAPRVGLAAYRSLARTEF